MFFSRIEEEDERMAAIQNGESGENKMKKYEPFESEVSSGNGKLDINSLANPLAAAGSALNNPPAPVKKIKQESKTCSPPPADSPKDLVTPPDSVSGDIKVVHQASSPSDILSPQSETSDCPPNVVSKLNCAVECSVLTTFTYRYTR